MRLYLEEERRRGRRSLCVRERGRVWSKGHLGVGIKQPRRLLCHPGHSAQSMPRAYRDRMLAGGLFQVATPRDVWTLHPARLWGRV